MNYLPFGLELRSHPHVMVDSAAGRNTTLDLSHWPGNRTPAKLKADTSTEIVLNAIREHVLEKSGCEYVSTDHYDIDGLLSLWAALNNGLAAARADLLVAAATTGDFDRIASEEGLRAALALAALENAVAPGIVRNAQTTGDVTAGLYRSLLEFVIPCIDRPWAFEPLWREEYDYIQDSCDAIDAGRATITHLPDVDLSVVESPNPLHDVAVNSATHCNRVLTACEGRFSLRYRYESFVEFRSRSIPPRIVLDELGSQLTALERNGGTWWFDGVAVAHPRLEFYRGTEAGAKSTITLERFIDLTVAFLSNATDAWDASAYWRSESHGPKPPSLRDS